MNEGRFVLYHSKQNKGNAIYIYYMIAWYFRRDKKPFRQTIKYLGAIDEHEVEFYKDSIACLNHDPGMFPCNINRLAVQKSNEFLSCAVGIHFWDYWELSSLFNDSGQKEVKTSDMAKILTVIRFVQTCSKSFTTELYPDTCLAQLTGVSPSLYNKARIFRELEEIETKREELGRHIFNLAKTRGYTQGELFFYDLSSANISGLQCVMAKWGHCKDGYDTHVVLLLVITPEGYPVYWEVLEGNTPDVKTIESLISKIEKTYGKIESVLCFDRGMVSDENLKLLEGKHIRFITALDGNQVDHFKGLIDFNLLERVKDLDIKKEQDKIKEYLTKADFKSVQENLFYKEFSMTETEKRRIKEITWKLDVDKRRYFLAFNPELAYLTQKHRRERVDAFKEWVETYNKELSSTLNDRKRETIDKAIKKEMKKRKIADVKIDYTLTEYKVENRNSKARPKKAITYKIGLKEITQESYKEAEQYDGLWVLITNISRDDDREFFNKTKFDSYFEIYRLKNNIEEAFRILSNFVGVEPFYVYKEEHIKAHFTICVLSYLIDITILNKIRRSDKIENTDLHNIFHALAKCKQDIIQLAQGRVVSRITQVTEKQKRLLDVLDCTYLVLPQYLMEKNIISIDKKCA